MEDSPLLVVALPKPAGHFVIFAGNLRSEGAKEAGLVDAPCVEYFPVTAEDRDTVIRRAMKDNGSFGKFDWDEIANDPVWGSFDLEAMGIPHWDPDGAKREAARQQMENGGLSSDEGESDDEYDEFVDKFKQKLTTDDCYTPPAVYDAVLGFVGTITNLEGRKVIRPFFPGGDYTKMTQYLKGCIVVDNPPFSLLSQIIRFYCAKGIDFFLFAPQLTLFSAADCDVTYIISDSEVVYENGAKVRTGFITNIVEDTRVWVCPDLKKATDEAQADEDKTKPGFVYPDNIITAATMGKIAKRSIEFKVRKIACEYIKDSDSAKAAGRSLYGGGFILSDRAAAERAAAERAAATRLNISDREREIIERLNEQDKD